MGRSRNGWALALLLITLPLSIAPRESWAQNSAKQAEQRPRPIGRMTLSDVRGGTHSTAEWRAHKAVLLFFLGTECPVSNFYAPEMQRIAAKYADRGVRCYGVRCEASLTSRQAAKHAEEYGLSFPILLDPDQKLARTMGARVTPDAIVLAADGNVMYRGRIDDRYAAGGKRRDEPTVLDLENALEAVLSGREPQVKETRGYGCPLPRPKNKRVSDR